mmetsp:Transcript_77187/g.153040  ORF Transcript_77187/g.153040 Transcript_77187/m.153040 type:complete len:678 (+) Transcript_77187:170-2203(+)
MATVQQSSLPPPSPRFPPPVLAQHSSGAVDQLRAEAESLVKLRRDLLGQQHRPSDHSRHRGAKLILPPPPGESALSHSVVPDSLVTNGDRVPGSLACCLVESAHALEEPAVQAHEPEQAVLRSVANGFVADRRAREQQELLQWSDALCRDVARVEQERSQLDQQVVTARLERQQLEVELDRMRRRCSELENLAALQGLGFGENDHLRKQLAAYAVEIEVLRSDREETRRALRTAQDSVQQLTIERDGLLLSLQEIRMERQVAEEERAGLEAKCLEEIACREDAEARQAAETEAMQASLQMAQSQSQDKQSHLVLSMEEAKRLNDEKDVRLKGFVDIIQDLMALVAKLQESHVQQTKDFGSLVGSVRKQQLAEEDRAQEAAQVLTEHQHLAEQTIQQLGRVQDLQAGSENSWHEERLRMQEQARQLAESNQVAVEAVQNYRNELNRRENLDSQSAAVELEQTARERDRRGKRLARQTVRANSNILKEMIEALSGLFVDKVSMKEGRRQRRKLKVHCGDFVQLNGPTRTRKAGQQLPKLELMWAKSPFRDFPHSSSVNLAEVTALGFGYSARATALFPEVYPPNCFSVYTPTRSFDFVCHEERHAEVFVMVLSRLCCRIQGWPVLGGISSRSKFLCARGWCKVETACRRRGTIGKHLLDCLKTVRLDENAFQERMHVLY